MEKEESELRNHPGDMFMPANVFESSVGHFWGIFETRAYMRARYALVEALREIHSHDSVVAQYNHLRDMMRLCRSDNMGLRDMIPALAVRFGRDQEAYDFIKWYRTVGTQDDYDWGDIDLGFLDLKDEVAFEVSSAAMATEFVSLAFSAMITLIKIRLMIDLQSLDAAIQNCGVKAPPEILDLVKIPLTDIVPKRKSLLQNHDHSTLIKGLKTEIRFWHNLVQGQNKHYWGALLSPGAHLTARPEAYSAGSHAEMQLHLQYTYKAWKETPGAIDIIGALEEGTWDVA